MRLSKILSVVVISLFIILLQSTYALAIEKILRVAGDRDYPPYEFVDNKNNYRGFNVDVITAIALEQGFTIEFYPMDWDEAQIALLEGKVDVIQGMTYSERRNEIYSFADPTVINSQAIFVNKSVNTVSSLSDLNGKDVAVQKGDITTEKVKQIEGINVIEFATQDEAIQALIQGKVDAFVGNELTGWYVLEKWRRLEDFKRVGEPFFETRYGPVVRKGDTETLKILNEGLAKIKSNGTYDKIYLKWFGKSFIDVERNFKITLIAIVIFSILVITAGIVLSRVNRQLKKKVEERTAEISSYANMQEAILRNAPTGILTIDKSGIVTTANPAVMRMLGGNILGNYYANIPILYFLNEEQIDKILNLHHKVQRTIEYKGQVLDVSVNPVIEQGEKVNGLLVNIDDITAERQLARKNLEETKVRTLSTLTAGIAHEIRNPLTSIKTYIDLLPSKIESKDFQEKVVQVIPKEINRIEQLINELIDYAKPRPAKLEMCNIRDTLEPVVELINARAEEKGIIFRSKLKHQVYCDPKHLKQIVFNLLLNSLNATNSGGRISLVSVSMDNYIRIIVKDTGYGIPEEFLDQVFDPFFSLKGGTGLGLALVKQMVEENNGFVKVSSKENKGVKFEVWLPANDGGDFDLA